MGRSLHRTPLVWMLAALALTGCAQFQHRSANHNGAKRSAEDLDRPFALARLNERQGNLEQAEQIYRSLEQKQPNDPILCHRLGVVAARRGRLEEARQRLTKAAELGGRSSELLTDLGYCHYLLDNLPAAEDALRNAIALEPQNGRARNNLALVVGQQGRFEESLANFKMVGSQAEAHANLAYVYSQVGQLEMAKQEYNLALTLNKDLRPAAEALAQIVHDEPARAKVRELAAMRHRRESPVERRVSPQAPEAPAVLAQLPPRRPMQEAPLLPLPEAPPQLARASVPAPQAAEKPSAPAIPPAAPQLQPRPQVAANLGLPRIQPALEAAVPPAPVALSAAPAPRPAAQPLPPAAPAVSQEVLTVAHTRTPETSLTVTRASATEVATQQRAAPAEPAPQPAMPVAAQTPKGPELEVNDYRLDANDSGYSPFMPNLGRTYKYRR